MQLPTTLAEYCDQYWPKNTPAFADDPTQVVSDSITVVTSFVDTGRGAWSRGNSESSSKFDRSVENYLSDFHRLARLNNRMIIFTTPELAERVLQSRRDAGLAHRTVVYSIADFFERPTLRDLRAAITRQSTARFRDFVWRPFAPEVNKPDYCLVTALKPTYVATAIDLGVVTTPQAAWIDFGYVRSDDLIEPGVEWTFDAGEKMNIFNIFRLDEKPIYDIVRGGEAYFAGGHIVGPVAVWPHFNRLYGDALFALLQCNLMDDDQTLMLMAWRREPAFFTLRCFPTNTEHDWRYVFQRFRTGLSSEVDPESLPEVRKDSKPPWLRDLSTNIRRRVRRWKRGLR